MITPYTLDTIIYRHELAYFKGKSLQNYKERKTAKRWTRIQRWYIERSIMAAVSLSALATQAYA